MWGPCSITDMDKLIRKDILRQLEKFEHRTLDKIKDLPLGQPRWRSGLALPAAQGVILETRDRVPRQAPCMEPASPSACVSVSLSLSVFHE